MASVSLPIVSAILLAVGIFLFKRTRPKKVLSILFILLAQISFFLHVFYAAIHQITGEGINEAAIYHIKYGIDGAGLFDYWLLITIACLALVLFGLFLFIHSPKRVAGPSGAENRNLTAPSIFVILSIFLSPTVIAFVDISLERREPTNDVTEIHPADFENFYRVPYAEPSGPKKKNLVMIYAESLERTFFDEELFPGLIKGLRRLEASSIYFTEIQQVSGTGWTIAGITASQCGIPLFTPAHGNSMSGMDQFLASAVCLSDLLKLNGYSLTFVGGADPNFAGKLKFLTTHGFSQVLGRDDLMTRVDDPSYRTPWGLYDDSMFEEFYRIFLKLSEENRNFGLFTLTLDTHSNGNPSEACEGIQYGNGSSSILNAVACSDFLISEVVERIRSSPYADDTLVVIASDHLAMKSSAYKLLKSGTRRNLFMIIDPAVSTPVRVETVGSTLDVGSTVLPFLGFEAEIGLGRNLLDAAQADAEREMIWRSLDAWKGRILDFWDFPIIERTLRIDSEAKVAVIDDRAFNIPMLIVLQETMQTVLKFEFDRSPGQMSLAEHAQNVQADEYFILIGACRDVAPTQISAGEDESCVVAGRGREIRLIQVLDEKLEWTVEEIRQQLKMRSSESIIRASEHAVALE